MNPPTLPPNDAKTAPSRSDLGILERLNSIGFALNHLLGNPDSDVAGILSLIVNVAVELLPGGDALIYMFDPHSGSFIENSRVATQGVPADSADDFPRSNGLGMRSISEKRRVISSEEPIPIHPVKKDEGAQLMICTPLIVNELPLGTLYLYLYEARELLPKELAILDTFVNQAALALFVLFQREESRRASERRAREMKRLRRAGTLISSRSSLQDTLQGILSLAMDVIEADFGIFRLVDSAGEHLLAHEFFGPGLAAPALESLKVDDQSIMGLAAVSGQTLNVGDLSSPPYDAIYYPLDSGQPMLSEIAVPLIGSNGRLEGVLNFESPHRDAFDPEAANLLEIFAAQAVIAIQEARLLDAIQELAGQTLTHTTAEVLFNIVDQAGGLLNVKSGQLWVVDGDQLRLDAYTGVRPDVTQLEIATSLTGHIISSRQPLATSDASRESAFRFEDWAREAGWQAALMVPVFEQDNLEPIGVLSIYSQDPSIDFSEADWEKKVMTLLGQLAGLALQNQEHLFNLRQAEEARALAETFAAVGDIAANLLHRLNNKVGTIPVRVEGLTDRYETLLAQFPHLAGQLAGIQTSAVEALQIVSDNLWHLHPMRLEPIALGTCIDDAIAGFNSSADIKIYREPMEHLPQVLVDQHRLSFVLTNLFENSVEALGGRGEINFGLLSVTDRIWVSYGDSGAGIAPEARDHVFELNFSTGQANNPGKLGFGMWWARTWLRRFGGDLRLSNKDADSHFLMAIPIAGVDQT